MAYYTDADGVLKWRQEPIDWTGFTMEGWSEGLATQLAPLKAAADAGMLAAFEPDLRTPEQRAEDERRDAARARTVAALEAMGVDVEGNHQQAPYVPPADRVKALEPMGGPGMSVDHQTGAILARRCPEGETCEPKLVQGGVISISRDGVLQSIGAGDPEVTAFALQDAIADGSITVVPPELADEVVRRGLATEEDLPIPTAPEISAMQGAAAGGGLLARLEATARANPLATGALFLVLGVGARRVFK